MVELRKRPAAPPAPPPAKRKSSAKGAVPKSKPDAKASSSNNAKATGEVKPPEQKPATVSAKAAGHPKKEDVISLEGFGGTFELNDGKPTTLKELVDSSKSGVVIFTYPKASTPGCTKQACLFRDAYKELTATGFDIYGLSNDSPKSNTNFQTKQNLPYALLCDPKASLIGALGYKKPPTSTTRGVIIVGKDGKVLESMAGGPDATFEAAKVVVTK